MELWYSLEKSSASTGRHKIFGMVRSIFQRLGRRRVKWGVTCTKVWIYATHCPLQPWKPHALHNGIKFSGLDTY
jgi:hypothetical protein